jgi:hypothetical protein
VSSRKHAQGADVPPNRIGRRALFQVKESRMMTSNPPGGAPAMPNPPPEVPPLTPNDVPPPAPVESPPDEEPVGIPNEPPPELPPNAPPEAPPATPYDLPPGRAPREPNE